MWGPDTLEAMVQGEDMRGASVYTADSGDEALLWLLNMTATALNVLFIQLQVVCNHIACTLIAKPLLTVTTCVQLLPVLSLLLGSFLFLSPVEPS